MLRILGPKWEVQGLLRKLYSAQYHNFYSSPDTVIVNKAGKEWMENQECKEIFSEES